MKSIYLSFYHLYKQHPFYKHVLLLGMKYLPFIFYIIYPLSILYLFVYHDSFIYLFLFKPLIGYILVSIVRKIINRPRPFEVYSIESLTYHHKGQSCPSKHTFSACIISFMFIPISLSMSIVLFILSFMIACTRVLGNYHFISDVVLSFILAFIIYVL